MYPWKFRLSGRKKKRFSKPWITRGVRWSIKSKNKLFLSGDTEKYRLYRNDILTLTRLFKKMYFHEYFETNLSSVKKTWEWINSLLNRRGNRKFASKIKKPDNSGFRHKTHPRSPVFLIVISFLFATSYVPSCPNRPTI